MDPSRSYRFVLVPMLVDRSGTLFRLLELFVSPDLLLEVWLSTSPVSHCVDRTPLVPSSIYSIRSADVFVIESSSLLIVVHLCLCLFPSSSLFHSLLCHRSCTSPSLSCRVDITATLICGMLEIRSTVDLQVSHWGFMRICIWFSSEFRVFCTLRK
jgi:hypothetical protein